MDRNDMLKKIRRTPQWDFVVIGGGATGLGVAIDAASRGYSTLLVDRRDFAHGTSSRSTKLVHGGVRYLQQGNVSLVLEALRERGIMRRNAPHLVHNLPFVVPIYDWWEGPFYGAGLKAYDMLAGRHGFGASRKLSREKTLQLLPTVEPEGLRGGVIYHDGQFDDARLAVNLAQTAVDQGAVAINYVNCTGLIQEKGMVSGIVADDAETGESFEIRSRAVINATGVYCDAIRKMDDADAPAMISPSQGVHIVLDKSFLPGDTAIMVPHTDDGRVLFAIPWHGHVVVGTTDTPISATPAEPCPLPEELEFLLSHAVRYLTRDPTPKDVLSAFAGLRPLVGAGAAENTAALSRDHTVHVSRTGLLTITGGKWTTYRKMAKDAVDHALILAKLDERPCVTKELNIHGYHKYADSFGELAVYGSDAPSVLDCIQEKEEYGRRLHAKYPWRAGEVAWAVRREMARTVEDFLSRRIRALLLDARASMEMAPPVAVLMAEILGRDRNWIDDQVQSFTLLAHAYLMQHCVL